MAGGRREDREDGLFRACLNKQLGGGQRNGWNVLPLTSMLVHFTLMFLPISHTQRVCLCFECVLSVFCVCTYTNIRRPGNGTWGSRTPTKTWICMSAKSANRTHRWQLSCPLPRRTKRKKWVGSKLCSPRWVLRVRMYGCGCLCGWIGRVGG